MRRRAAAMLRLFEKQRQRSAKQAKQGEDAEAVCKSQQGGLV